jgi:hypothetical protein
VTVRGALEIVRVPPVYVNDVT